MALRPIIAAAVLVSGLLFAPGLSAAEATADSTALPPGRNPALVVGERLTYSVRYGMIKAGTATLEISGLMRINGHVALQIVSTATSNSVFDKIYTVRDRVMSLMDADSLYSHYFEKHLREGGYKADQSVRFDHTRNVATYNNGTEYPIDRGCYDVLAAFYRVRTMPLEIGSVFYLTSHTDKKNYPLRVSVLGRQEVDTPAGKFTCLVVEPRLKSGAFFKNEGRLTIYLTDDARRIPVLMRSKIPVGSISVILTDVQRPERKADRSAGETGVGRGAQVIKGR